MHKDLNRIASQLYDGVIFAGDWHAGLDGLRGALGAEVFHFFTMDSREACVVDSVDNQGTVGVNADKLREYERHYVTSDLRMSILTAMPVGQIMLDHEHISARDMSRNPVYTDFLGRHGFWNTLGIPVRDDGASRDFLGFLRAADRDHYTDHERDMVRQLMPDLARAARLRAHTSHVARQAAIGLAALDSLPQGIAVVDGSGFCQHANATARALMNRRMLTVRHGRVMCADTVQGVHLARLMAAACAKAGLRSAGSICVQAASGRLVISVVPLKPDHSMPLPKTPLALLVMVDPDAPTLPDSAAVADMLGVSPTEMRLALHLAAGKTVKDFAVTEECSWHTARTHLKNLMRKTGCHRQTDVVALLLALRLG